MNRRYRPPARVVPLSLGGVPALLVEIDVAPLPDSLTESERAIVALVLDGRSGAEIAVLRGRSYRTIANQLAAIYRKFGVNARMELVARLSGTDDS